MNAITQAYGARPSMTMAEICRWNPQDSLRILVTASSVSTDSARQAQVLIRDCNVSNNPGPYNDMCVGFGGAVACANSTTLIEHCTVKGNRALVNTLTFIGGVNAGLGFANSDVTLNDTLIEGNEALYVPAVDVGQNSTVVINRCNIKENRALSIIFLW